MEGSGKIGRGRNIEGRWEGRAVGMECENRAEGLIQGGKKRGGERSV